jgi:hypothetical protein
MHQPYSRHIIEKGLDLICVADHKNMWAQLETIFPKIYDSDPPKKNFVRSVDDSV